MLLSSSIWGILADKYGRRTILVVSIRDRIASLKSQTTFDSYYIATKREHSCVKCVYFSSVYLDSRGLTSVVLYACLVSYK